MRKYYVDIVIVAFIIFSAIFLSFTSERKKVFFLGDSISTMYGKYLPPELKSRIIYARKGDVLSRFNASSFYSQANGEDSEACKNYIDNLFLYSNCDADYIVLNFGLHDVKKSKNRNAPLVSIAEYAQNLEYALTTILEKRITPIFITTTPINDSVHNLTEIKFNRYNRDVVAYNQKAVEICKEKQVKIIDLYEFTTNLVKNQHMYSDHVHFDSDVWKKQT